MKKKPTYELKNWTLEEIGGSYRLRGKVYGRADVSAGDFIITTNLKSIDFDKSIAETKNSIYKLEKN